MHVYVQMRRSRLADASQLNILDAKSSVLGECAAEQQYHALPKLVGCRVGDGERAACRKGSGCPMLPGPRKEPIMS